MRLLRWLDFADLALALGVLSIVTGVAMVLSAGWAVLTFGVFVFVAGLVLATVPPAKRA